MEDISNTELLERVKEKIKQGEDLINSINDLGYVNGIEKLSRKINQEIKFLKKIQRNNSAKKEHLNCSNLTHFTALVETLRTIPNCQSVNKTFTHDDRKLTIDIVSDEGSTWIKVIARNPKSMKQICMGNSGYGVRSIFDQATEYLECSRMHPIRFTSPTVVFVFTNGIDDLLARKLESYGIVVKGNRIESASSEFESENSENSDSDDCDVEIQKNESYFSDNSVNLDVSAMLAYCSSVTNGSAHLYDFDVPVLQQQAEWERLRPQKPILDNFFKGKNLFCCKTASDSFQDIVNTVGGPNEKERAIELMSRVTVLDDDAGEGSVFSGGKNLVVGGQIKARSLIVFAFGERIRAVTVTANEGFVRAARQQGVTLAVFLHESRALTEQKERLKAKPLIM